MFFAIFFALLNVRVCVCVWEQNVVNA